MPDELQTRLRTLLGLPTRPTPTQTPVVQAEWRGDGYVRKSVCYPSAGSVVQAYLFEPIQSRRTGAVVALHQHNSQWHLGKSEIAGLAGDPLQAFGPALARSGLCVLAPDAIGFESRRGMLTSAGVSLAPPLQPAKGSSAEDWLQYYNHAMHRLVRGELLMRDLLVDVASAVDAAQQLSNAQNVGILGHSHGGNVALFAAALDSRVGFVAASGAACSYRHKLAHRVGLDMSLVIPGFAASFDIDDLLVCIAPRPALIVSSHEDPLAADAEDLVARAQLHYAQSGATHLLQHVRTPGPHNLDPVRFEAIVTWLDSQTQ